MGIKRERTSPKKQMVFQIVFWTFVIGMAALDWLFDFNLIDHLPNWVIYLFLFGVAFAIVSKYDDYFAGLAEHVDDLHSVIAQQSITISKLTREISKLRN